MLPSPLVNLGRVTVKVLQAWCIVSIKKFKRNQMRT